MMIFLDSNILCSDFYMRNAYFYGIKKIGTIVLGQIVVDETVNKYRELLSENIQQLNRAIGNINRMVNNQVLMSLDNMLETETEKYRDFLDIFSIESGMGDAESYPDDPHEQVVHRALQRKKPFKEDGSTGYRDYLVWRTVLNLAGTYQNEEIHFISKNVKDFSDPKDINRLHKDLLEDLEQHGISCDRFHYWISMKNFLENYASERILEIEQREKIVEEIEKNTVGYHKKLTEYIENSIIGIDISNEDVCVPGKRATIKTIEGYSVNLLYDIAEITESSYLLEICIDCECIVESHSNETEISEVEDNGLFYVESIERKDSEWLIQTAIGLQIHLCVIYDRESSTIESIQLDYIDDNDCPYCCWE